MEKQSDLNGNVVEPENESIGNESVSLMKSTLQKCIRQGLVEPSMYWSLKLAEADSWSVWRRLSIIADEDCGQADVIVAVDVLFRKFMALKKQNGKDRTLTWDMKRHVVCAAKLLAESPKDRRSDEFLELVDVMEKNPNLKFVHDMFSVIPDESYDLHTLQGRRMGRGLLFWYECSSRTVNKTGAYVKWHRWFQPLMIHLVKAKEESKKK